MNNVFELLGDLPIILGNNLREASWSKEVLAVRCTKEYEPEPHFIVEIHISSVEALKEAHQYCPDAALCIGPHSECFDKISFRPDPYVALFTLIYKKQEEPTVL